VIATPGVFAGLAATPPPSATLPLGQDAVSVRVDVESMGLVVKTGCSPVAPEAPAGPAGPAGPCGPCSPCGPCGI
jgi:hypothetical protein